MENTEKKQSLEFKRKISQDRARELKQRIQDYLDYRSKIPKGLELGDTIAQRQEKIMEVLGCSAEQWNDWKWQLSNRIGDLETLSKIVDLKDNENQGIEEVSQKFRWSISPYYLSLMDWEDKFCPIRLMALPNGIELAEDGGKADPMAEEYTNPAGTITRRYPDRLIINITNECAMYCRHCQRRRNIGDTDKHKSREEIMQSIEYIRKNPEIRDVLITGGDPLTQSDQFIDWLLSQVKSIPHVEYIRLGTRTLVTMPQRITEELCQILKKYHPIYINTHFNHPIEITEQSKKACEMLANVGIPLGNQAVLLNGVNNNKHVMKLLNQEMLKIRVRPYYIFHPKHVIGTGHFSCSIDDGIEIMEYLRGYTSGMAIPTYIVNAPKGQGKTPILPNYIVSRGSDYVTLRTWEGKIMKYKNYPTQNIRKILGEN